MTRGADAGFKDRLERSLPRRFYEAAAVSEDGPPYAISLDGRAVHTPNRAALELPGRALAEAVRAEWEAQREVIDPATMPMTRLSNTAIDRVAPDRARIVSEIVDYAGSDLLCYRAETPQELVRRQSERWEPVLTWAAQHLGARFVAVTGLVHHQQPPATLAAVEAAVQAHEAFALAALHNMTTLTDSAVVALAVAHDAVTPDAAWEAAHVDEDWNIEMWGRDTEAERRRRARKEEFDAAVRLLRLTVAGQP